MLNGRYIHLSQSSEMIFDVEAHRFVFVAGWQLAAHNLPASHKGQFLEFHEYYLLSCQF